MAWLKDRDGRYLSVNESFEKFSGHEKTEVLGKQDKDIWPQELAEKFRLDYEKVLKQKKKTFVEEKIASNIGNIWVETFKTPIFASSNRLVIIAKNFFVGIFPCLSNLMPSYLPDLFLVFTNPNGFLVIINSSFDGLYST